MLIVTGLLTLLAITHAGGDHIKGRLHAKGGSITQEQVAQDDISSPYNVNVKTVPAYGTKVTRDQTRDVDSRIKGSKIAPAPALHHTIKTIEERPGNTQPISGLHHDLSSVAQDQVTIDEPVAENLSLRGIKTLKTVSRGKTRFSQEDKEVRDPIARPVIQTVKSVEDPVARPVIQTVKSVEDPVARPVIQTVKSVEDPVTRTVIQTVKNIEYPVDDSSKGIKTAGSAKTRFSSQDSQVRNPVSRPVIQTVKSVEQPPVSQSRTIKTDKTAATGKTRFLQQDTQVRDHIARPVLQTEKTIVVPPNQRNVKTIHKTSEPSNLRTKTTLKTSRQTIDSAAISYIPESIVASARRNTLRTSNPTEETFAGAPKRASTSEDTQAPRLLSISGAENPTGYKFVNEKGEITLDEETIKSLQNTGGIVNESGEITLNEEAIRLLKNVGGVSFGQSLPSSLGISNAFDANSGSGRQVSQQSRRPVLLNNRVGIERKPNFPATKPLLRTTEQSQNRRDRTGNRASIPRVSTTSNLNSFQSSITRGNSVPLSPSNIGTVGSGQILSSGDSFTGGIQIGGGIVRGPANQPSFELKDSRQNLQFTGSTGNAQRRQGTVQGVRIQDGGRRNLAAVLRSQGAINTVRGSSTPISVEQIEAQNFGQRSGNVQMNTFHRAGNKEGTMTDILNIRRDSVLQRAPVLITEQAPHSRRPKPARNNASGALLNRGGTRSQQQAISIPKEKVKVRSQSVSPITVSSQPGAPSSFKTDNLRQQIATAIRQPDITTNTETIFFNGKEISISGLREGQLFDENLQPLLTDKTESARPDVKASTITQNVKPASPPGIRQSVAISTGSTYGSGNLRTGTRGINRSQQQGINVPKDKVKQRTAVRGSVISGQQNSQAGISRDILRSQDAAGIRQSTTTTNAETIFFNGKEISIGGLREGQLFDENLQPLLTDKTESARPDVKASTIPQNVKPASLPGIRQGAAISTSTTYGSGTLRTGTRGINRSQQQGINVPKDKVKQRTAVRGSVISGQQNYQAGISRDILRSQDAAGIRQSTTTKNAETIFFNGKEISIGGLREGQLFDENLQPLLTDKTESARPEVKASTIPQNVKPASLPGIRQSTAISTSSTYGSGTLRTGTRGINRSQQQGINVPKDKVKQRTAVRGSVISGQQNYQAGISRDILRSQDAAGIRQSTTTTNEETIFFNGKEISIGGLREGQLFDENLQPLLTDKTESARPDVKASTIPQNVKPSSGVTATKYISRQSQRQRKPSMTSSQILSTSERRVLNKNQLKISPAVTRTQSGTRLLPNLNTQISETLKSRGRVTQFTSEQIPLAPGSRIVTNSASTQLPGQRVSQSSDAPSDVGVLPPFGIRRVQTPVINTGEITAGISEMEGLKISGAVPMLNTRTSQTFSSGQRNVQTAGVIRRPGFQILPTETSDLGTKDIYSSYTLKSNVGPSQVVTSSDKSPEIRKPLDSSNANIIFFNGKQINVDGLKEGQIFDENLQPILPEISEMPRKAEAKSVLATQYTKQTSRVSTNIPARSSVRRTGASLSERQQSTVLRRPDEVRQSTPLGRLQTSGLAVPQAEDLRSSNIAGLSQGSQLRKPGTLVSEIQYSSQVRSTGSLSSQVIPKAQQIAPKPALRSPSQAQNQRTAIQRSQSSAGLNSRRVTSQRPVGSISSTGQPQISSTGILINRGIAPLQGSPGSDFKATGLAQGSPKLRLRSRTESTQAGATDSSRSSMGTSSQSGTRLRAGSIASGTSPTTGSVTRGTTSSRIPAIGLRQQYSTGSRITPQIASQRFPGAQSTGAILPERTGLRTSGTPVEVISGLVSPGSQRPSITDLRAPGSELPKVSTIESLRASELRNQQQSGNLPGSPITLTGQSSSGIRKPTSLSNAETIFFNGKEISIGGLREGQLFDENLRPILSGDANSQDAKVLNIPEIVRQADRSRIRQTAAISPTGSVYGSGVLSTRGITRNTQQAVNIPKDKLKLRTPSESPIPIPGPQNIQTGISRDTLRSQGVASIRPLTTGVSTDKVFFNGKEISIAGLREGQMFDENLQPIISGNEESVNIDDLRASSLPQNIKPANLARIRPQGISAGDSRTPQMPGLSSTGGLRRLVSSQRTATLPQRPSVAGSRRSGESSVRVSAVRNSGSLPFGGSETRDASNRQTGGAWSSGSRNNMDASRSRGSQTSSRASSAGNLSVARGAVVTDEKTGATQSVSPGNLQLNQGNIASKYISGYGSRRKDSRFKLSQDSITQEITQDRVETPVIQEKQETPIVPQYAIPYKADMVKALVRQSSQKTLEPTENKQTQLKIEDALEQHSLLNTDVEKTVQVQETVPFTEPKSTPNVPSKKAFTKISQVSQKDIDIPTIQQRVTSGDFSGYLPKTSFLSPFNYGLPQVSQYRVKTPIVQEQQKVEQVFV